MLHDLGFAINAKKSVLVPSQIIEYLGFVINSNTMRVTLPTNKVAKIIAAIQDLVDKPTTSIRHVASVQGKLAAMAPACPMAPLYT